MLAQLVPMEAQIQHKVDIFQDVIFLNGRPPVVILAHSIGGYMTLHAMPQLQEMAAASSIQILKVNTNLNQDSPSMTF